MCDLKEVHVDGVRCPDDPSAVLPLLLWSAALDVDSWVLWLWHHRGGPATQSEDGGARVWRGLARCPGEVHTRHCARSCWRMCKRDGIMDMASSKLVSAATAGAV